MGDARDLYDDAGLDAHAAHLAGTCDDWCPYCDDADDVGDDGREPCPWALWQDTGGSEG